MSCHPGQVSQPPKDVAARSYIRWMAYSLLCSSLLVQRLEWLECPPSAGSDSYAHPGVVLTALGAGRCRLRRPCLCQLPITAGEGWQDLRQQEACSGRIALALGWYQNTRIADGWYHLIVDCDRRGTSTSSTQPRAASAPAYGLCAISRPYHAIAPGPRRPLRDCHLPAGRMA